MKRLTRYERLLTREALEYDPGTSKARREAERISMLSGYWEAMAVQTAIAGARRDAERKETA